MPSGYPGITCPACEDVLKNDSQHAVLPRDVPMTYDESSAAADAEKSGRVRRENALGFLAQQLSAVSASTPAQLGPACPAGPLTPAGARFCGHCGTPMGEPASCADGHEIPPGMRFCGECGKGAVPSGTEAAPATGRPSRARGAAA